MPKKPTETIRLSCEFVAKLRIIVAALKGSGKESSIGTYIEESMAPIVANDMRSAHQAVGGMVNQQSSRKKS